MAAAAGAPAPAAAPQPSGGTPAPAGLTLRSCTFAAMGSTATICLTGPPGLLHHGRRCVAALETVWSRFRLNSTVSRLNRSAAGARRPISVDVDPHTALLVHRARLAWLATGGLFDPTVLDSLTALGYDDDLAAVRARGPAQRSRSTTRPGDTPAAGMEGVYVDLGRSRVTVPAGFCFDPGAIGKGLAADLVAADLVRRGASNVNVNIGGDLRVMRSAQVGQHPGWHVRLDLPMLRRDKGFHLASGAAATSYTDARTWAGAADDGPSGRVRRHLLDPRTGRDLPRSGPTEVVGVTVVAGQAWLADALATAALVAGGQQAAALLLGARTPAVLVEAGGRVRCVGAMRGWLR